MSTDCLKLENNLCRCCHAEGSFKTLGVTIGTEGREVYADMLRIYLDVNLTPVPGPLCLVTYTICEECVQRLYDAVDFKKQILECEERFRDMYRRDVIKACKPDVEVKVEVDATDIPSTFVEELKVECPPEPNETQDDTDFEYQDVIEVDAPEETAKESVTIKEQDSKKEEDSKKKDKGKGKAKVVKTGKKVGRPKKSESSDAEKKTKKDGPLPELYSTFYTVVKEGEGENGKYLCVKCLSEFSTLSSLKRHIDTHHIISPVKCPLCEAEFMKTSRKIKTHLSQVHGMEMYKSGSQILLRPLQKWICDICQAEFITKRYLSDHKQNNHELSKCPDCELSFKKGEMAMHRHMAHGNPIPTCGICGYKNAFQHRINNHQRKIHLKEKNVTCEICNMKFFSVFYLNRHKVRHGTSKKYECSFCFKEFPRKSALRTHEMIHKGVKNKVCHLCDAKFVQKASLNYHVIKHHPDSL